MRVAIIGGGSFGTALAKLLEEVSHEVTLWVRTPTLARELAAQRENRIYLPGVLLAPRIRVTSAIAEAVTECELLLAVSPSHVMRDVMLQARPYVRGVLYVVSAAKGVEEGSLHRMSEVLIDVLGPEFRARAGGALRPKLCPRGCRRHAHRGHGRGAQH